MAGLIDNFAPPPPPANSLAQVLQAIAPTNWGHPYAGPGPYRTPLISEQEARFRTWLTQNKVPFDPNDPKSDYDMRAYWLAQAAGDANARQSLNRNDKRMHFPDTYKTPYPKSFSNESKYAAPSAPHWNAQDQLVNALGKIVFDERAKK